MGVLYIAGSLNMDVVAFAARLPLPGETVTGSNLGFFPGGKGLNPAVAAARQGREVRLIGKLGKDAFGDQLHEFAERSGIDLRYLLCSDAAPSGTAIIVVGDGGENSIVVIPGTNGILSPEEALRPEFEPGDVLLTMFEIPQNTVKAFLEAGRKASARTILSPSPAMPFDFRDLPDMIVLNETELARYLERDLGGAEMSDLEQAASEFRSHPSQTVVLTLGRAGSLAVGSEGAIRVEGTPVEAADTTGAGDCYVGNLAAQLANGCDLGEAMRYANAAAAISVTRPGAAPSMPTADEVRRMLEANS